MPESPHLVVTTIVIIGLSVGVSLLALWLVRRLVSHEWLSLHNDVSGFVYAVIGVVYAVIVALVLVSVWEEYSDAEANARHEAGALGNLHRIAEGFPDPSREALQAATLDYAAIVIDDEWPAMLDGDPAGTRELAHTDALWSALHRFDVRTQREQNLHAAALDQLDALSSHRRERLEQAESGLLGILWVVMIGGGILTVLFPCVFGVEDGRLHALIVAVLAATVGLLLLTVYQLNTSFQGAVHIEPDGFELVLEQFGGDDGNP